MRNIFTVLFSVMIIMILSTTAFAVNLVWEDGKVQNTIQTPLPGQTHFKNYFQSGVHDDNTIDYCDVPNCQGNQCVVREIQCVRCSYRVGMGQQYADQPLRQQNIVNSNILMYGNNDGSSWVNEKKLSYTYNDAKNGNGYVPEDKLAKQIGEYTYYNNVCWYGSSIEPSVLIGQTGENVLFLMSQMKDKYLVYNYEKDQFEMTGTVNGLFYGTIPAHVSYKLVSPKGGFTQIVEQDAALGWV